MTDETPLLAPKNESHPSHVHTMREKMNIFFEDPQSSRAAFAFANLMMVLILFSIVVFCVETMPKYYDKNEGLWLGLEAAIMAIFTLEYVLRLFAASDRLKWMILPLNIIDFVAILPIYITLITNDAGSDNDASGLSIVRVLRLVRIFRIFKFSRYSLGLQVVFRTLIKSTPALILLGFILSTTVVVFGTLMWYCERGRWDEATQDWRRSNGDPSPFQSIPDSFWYVIITMTTVG